MRQVKNAIRGALSASKQARPPFQEVWVWVFLGHEKQLLDVDKKPRYQIGTATARDFYAINQNKVSNKVFNIIARDNVNKTLDGSAKLNKL